jgi:hypothetical protein
MSKEMTAEEYYEMIKNDEEIITPVHCKHYGDLRAKEAVKEFAEEILSILSKAKLTKDVLASDIVLHTMSTIKHLAKQKGVEI